MNEQNLQKNNSIIKLGIAEIFIIISLSIILAISMGQIILRNFFHSGISGADSLIRHMVLWIVFSGASIAARDGSHIKIDAISKILPKGWLRQIDIIVTTFSFVICCLLIYASYVFLKSEYDYNSKITFLHLPAYLFEIIIPAGYAIIAFYFIKNIIKKRGKID